jgi:hypothetical protein
MIRNIPSVGIFVLSLSNDRQCIGFFLRGLDHNKVLQREKAAKNGNKVS